MRKILKAFGCFFVRQGKGDHEIWHSPITNCNVSVDGEIRSRHSANDLLKEAGIPYRFR
ncbi:MAG: type II toxin-antitoxin system HicA family toxin [Synergistaceae bacterium]|nr:type II toxin-antitoxin system HicA family toxin [Synergistaceae bacterium]MBQ3693448.1 type II toxin-antitoxin system HicA family toxin [Synergistaceae bacterium]MBR0069725.1 type II toxin-antitoxin system HicA family toxin [Synergistaceae bacterium]